MTLMATTEDSFWRTHNAIDAPLNLPEIEARIEAKEQLVLPKDETLDLLKQLSAFDLGKFLLKNKGLDGFWTSYIIINGPKREEKNLYPLEYWFLHRAPTVLATQQRFVIFQDQLTQYVEPLRLTQNNDEGITIASIPCGLMDDLFTHEKIKGLRGIHLVGVDCDNTSLEIVDGRDFHADSLTLIQTDAWELNETKEYNIILSNGLNIYEPDDDRVKALYQQFFNALKPNGILITSFLTPPCCWQDVNPEDAQKQRAIFTDVIEAKWQVFRTEEQTRKQLESVGFTILDVIYDKQRIFPTIVAGKIHRWPK